VEELYKEKLFDQKRILSKVELQASALSALMHEIREEGKLWPRDLLLFRNADY
jgi:hypothetical protein